MKHDDLASTKSSMNNDNNNDDYDKHVEEKLLIDIVKNESLPHCGHIQSSCKTRRDYCMKKLSFFKMATDIDNPRRK